MADKYVYGAINCASNGTISIREIIAYVEKKTGIKAILDESRDAAPYNGEPVYSVNID